MDTAVEVRYAGVVVGRGALVKDLGAEGAFVGLAEPLPVGTLVTLKIVDVVREARVDDVVESAEPSAAGMRVRWGGAAPARPVAAPAAVHEGPEARASSAATAGDSGPTPTAAAPDDGSGAISAPLGLASPGGDGQQGGGKKRRKRR